MKITVLTENTAVSEGVAAEHGLSLYIETLGKRILFDMGQSDLFERNARALGVDLCSVDLAVLSHGHYDHGGGLKSFLEINRGARVYLSRHAFLPHYSGKDRYIGLDTSLEGEERLSFVGERLTLCEGVSLFSGDALSEVTELDPCGLTMLEGGEIVPEDFRHEQYMLVTEGEKRILISGCSHKGILNIVDSFKPDVFIGGFHLNKYDPEGEGREKLVRIANELLKYDAVYYTGHCTGIPQYEFMKDIMGDRLGYIPTGASITV